ncbi:hypothetical protein OUZ56_008821 [Daphnia magna]|uniref:Uncharacterized protein n=1 Tax=Daphnia magna TaxID=35525 RepID=A0ABR0AED9_9CRUS|nr:hypothetical protein OUZ56_008821 [Daphnia magna]
MSALGQKYSTFLGRYAIPAIFDIHILWGDASIAATNLSAFVYIPITQHVKKIHRKTRRGQKATGCLLKVISSFTGNQQKRREGKENHNSTHLPLSFFTLRCLLVSTCASTAVVLVASTHSAKFNTLHRLISQQPRRLHDRSSASASNRQAVTNAIGTKNAVNSGERFQTNGIDRKASGNDYPAIAEKRLICLRVLSGAAIPPCRVPLTDGIVSLFLCPSLAYSSRCSASLRETLHRPAVTSIQAMYKSSSEEKKNSAESKISIDARCCFKQARGTFFIV